MENGRRGTYKKHDEETNGCIYEKEVGFVNTASRWPFNPSALELDIYSLVHNLCKMLIFYEPRSVTLGNTRHFVEEWTKMARESLKKIIKYICWLNI